jgi:hypothetical protein
MAHRALRIREASAKTRQDGASATYYRRLLNDQYRIGELQINQ